MIFTALAELSPRQIAQNDEAVGFNENKKSAEQGGNIAKNARKALEQKITKKIVDDSNFLGTNYLEKK